MNTSLPVDHETITALRTAGPWKISMFGRNAQAGVEQISAEMLRISAISEDALRYKEILVDAILALRPEGKRNFLQSVWKIKPTPTSPEQLRKKIDAVVATLMTTDQSLRKNEKMIAHTQIAADKVKTALLEKRDILLRVADGADAEVNTAAVAAAKEMDLSVEVVNAMLLTMGLIRENVNLMVMGNSLILDDWVPVWDARVDDLEKTGESLMVDDPFFTETIVNASRVYDAETEPKSIAPTLEM